MLLRISVREKEQRRGKEESILHPQHSSLKNAVRVQRSLVMLKLKGPILLSVNRVFMCIACP